jgi:polyferredoxin
VRAFVDAARGGVENRLVTRTCTQAAAEPPAASARRAADDAGDAPAVDRAQIRRSRASRWRACVLIAVHVAIAAHVAHWWITGHTLSPIEPSEAMEFSKRGLVNAGAVFFAVAIASTALLGRWFCGWACHVVALQDLCLWLLAKVRVRPKPVQLGVLGAVPWVVFAYMFLAPLVQRALHGDDLGVRAVEFGTAEFLRTFSGAAVAAVTLAVCGFGVVYFLGAKGFCTYGCPYGAIFGVADQLAPVRIRVDERCNGCGHCTAVCTSNVRVHQEVRDFGAVVDPGCMKCLDCVSVCPMDALRVGAGAPAIATARRRAPAGRARAPLAPRLAREALLAVFVAATFALLLAFNASFDARLWLVLTLGSLAIALAFRGKSQRGAALPLGEDALAAAAFLGALFAFRGTPPWPGAGEGIPLLFALGLAALTAYGALVAARLARKRDVSLQHVELKRAGALRPAGYAFACALLPILALGAGGVAWQVDARGAAADRALARTEYNRGVERFGAGDLEAAITAFEAALERDPEFVEARENLAGALCARGRFAQGIAHYRAALARRPDDADTRVLLAQALAAGGDPRAAEVELRAALAIVPEHAEARRLLALVVAAQGADDESVDRGNAAPPTRER